MFPLKNYQYQIPEGHHPGAFGFERKHDIYTGVDLYCQKGDAVHAIEDGVVIAVEPFTGEIAGFPWWNNTYAMAIRGASGIVNYGEIEPLPNIRVGDTILEGQVLGVVIPVLKVDKGKVPSTSMLHVELYNSYDGHWIEWELGKEQPKGIEDPTTLLKSNMVLISD